MKNTNKNRNIANWKSQLNNIKTQLEENITSEEKERLKCEEQEKKNRTIEFNKRKKKLYQFLAGYKQNSGIFINNFFRNRDYDTYCQDKFYDFAFDVSGIMPNIFDDPAFSMYMVQYLRELEKGKYAYYPITCNYVERLINFAEILELMEPLEEDIIVYRGCSTLERNGVNGIVSTTTDKKIAEQFSRGTILTIHVPKGTKCLDVKSIRPKEQRKKDRENEILLPPCKYHILNQEVINKSENELNNYTETTKLIELIVSPLNLLEEFLKIAENPPTEYLKVREVQGNDYYETIDLIRTYLQKKKQPLYIQKIKK